MESAEHIDAGPVNARVRRLRTILSIALPIIGGMLSQNVLNLVDTAMVSRLGDAALAAVGIGSFAHFMATAFVTGMSAGVQATAARWLGAGRKDETAVALNGGLVLAVAFAIPLAALLILAVPFAVPYLAADPDVAPLTESYLTVRLLGMAGLGMNFAFRGYWNAVQMSRMYMGTLVLMHTANVFGNWVLIFGNLGAPALGVAGAATATTLSVYLGTICYFVLGFRHARAAGFLAEIPSAATLLAMLRVSVPAGLQSFLFAAGMTVFFTILGRVGTRELAASHVLLNLMLVAILPSIGYGLAAATLVGQSLGAGDPDEAEAWGWRVAGLAALTVGVLVFPAALFPDVILGGFLHDPLTLALARDPLRLTAAIAVLDAVGMVMLNAHLGAGSSRRVMVVSVATQWGLFLPAVYVLGPVLGFGLFAIWTANGAQRLLSAGIFALSWRQRRWVGVEL